MGLYTGNRWFEEEVAWLKEEAEKGEKSSDPAKVGKKSDKYKEDDDKDKEITNPSIECGQYLVTINLKTKKVEIDDTEYDNQVELTFDQFKKINQLYNKTDTRPDKRNDLVVTTTER